MKSRVGWLALFPVAGFLSGGYFSAHLPPLVGGLPFLLVWNCAWALVTSAVLTVIFHFDPANRADDE